MEVEILKSVMNLVGLPGLLFLIWYKDNQKISSLKSLVEKYAALFEQSEQRYEHLVTEFSNICKDLKDHIVYNTQELTSVKERVLMSRCPYSGKDKKNE